MTKALTVRFRIDFSNDRSIGVGKIELLENIARSGSLSQAARDLGMSYRRAWLLVEDMKLSFDRPVVTSSTGGPNGGGATLTDFGGRLIARYRKLESDMQRLARTALRDIADHTSNRPRAGRSRNVNQTKGTARQRIVGTDFIRQIPVASPHAERMSGTFAQVVEMRWRV